jgi:hypothetical protein
LTTVAAFRRVVEQAIADIIADGRSVPPDTEVTIVVRDQQQETVGQGRAIVVPGRATATLAAR